MIKVFKKIKPDTIDNPLLLEIEETKSALTAAYTNFENVVEPDLIDSCIYELKAVQLRYKFLLNKLRDLEDSEESIREQA